MRCSTCTLAADLLLSPYVHSRLVCYLARMMPPFSLRRSSAHRHPENTLPSRPPQRKGLGALGHHRHRAIRDNKAENARKLIWNHLRSVQQRSTRTTYIYIYILPITHLEPELGVQRERTRVSGYLLQHLGTRKEREKNDRRQTPADGRKPIADRGGRGCVGRENPSVRPTVLRLSAFYSSTRD